MEGDQPPNAKAKLTEVNSYLTCPLCKGYYIDATTIVECLHSFCRSCIIQHLQQDNYCPICELMINTAKPNIKPDKTLQDIVYKLVPGLYAAEMARRRRYWAERPAEAAKVACPEARGLMTERIIFSPQDAISLSIEYTSDEPVAPTTAAWQRSEPDPEVPLRRYLQCPAMLRVEHLKKFICNKYNVESQLYHVDILYKRVPLPDHYTLMDIAYIYTWKRNEPMKFFFRITDIALVSERFDYFEPSSKQTSQTTRCQQQPRAVTKQQTITNNNNNNNVEKKSASLVRQPAKNNGISSDIIKTITCDSDKNQTELNNKLSDKKQCSDKKNEKDIKSDQNKCEKKFENIKRCSDEKDKQLNEITNGNHKDKSEKSDNKNSNRKISENNDTIKLKQEKSVVQNQCETRCMVKIDKDNSSESNMESVKSSVETNSKADNLKIENQINSKVPIKPENSRIKEEISLKNNIKSKEIKVEQKETSPIINENAEDTEKSQFLMSIQLTAKNSSPPSIKNSSPPALKPIIPDLLRPKLPAQKRKYVRKNEKSPNSAKKPKLTENKPNEPIKKVNKLSDAIKMRKIAHKDVKEDQGLKIKNIKNPIVRLMVSNLNKQATNLTKIVGQADGSKLNNIEQNQNEQKLQSLIDSCKINIPSSLSITLTESPRNEDGTIVQSKPAAIKPVQNYIEILKLPDKNVPDSDKPNDTLTETSKKSDSSDTENEQNKSSSTPLNRNSQKHTFQTMFEETIKREESMKAQLFQIQNQAKSLEMAKKTTNCIKINIPKTVKKQQNNALDLSTTSPKSESSSPSPNNSHNQNITNTNSPNNFLNKVPLQNMAKVPLRNGQITPNSIGPNPTNNSNPHKRNILEIAHQLSKRSRIESETLKVPTVSPNSSIIPKVSPNPSYASPRSNTVSPKPSMSPKPSCMSPRPSSISPKLSNMSPRLDTISPKLGNMSPKLGNISPKLGNMSPKLGNISPKLGNMSPKLGNMSPKPNAVSPKPKGSEPNATSTPQQIRINSNFSSGGSILINRSPKKVAIPKLNPSNIKNGGLLKFSNYTAKLASSSANNVSNTNSPKSPTKVPTNGVNMAQSSVKNEGSNNTIQGLTPNQILEKYNITNLAQFNANLNQAQFAFQQALMVTQQMEFHRMQQQNSQKHWMTNSNILAHYENYVQSLKNQQNQIIGNSSKN